MKCLRISVESFEECLKNFDENLFNLRKLYKTFENIKKFLTVLLKLKLLVTVLSVLTKICYYWLIFISEININSTSINRHPNGGAPPVPPGLGGTRSIGSGARATMPYKPVRPWINTNSTNENMLIKADFVKEKNNYKEFLKLF